MVTEVPPPTGPEFGEIEVNPPPVRKSAVSVAPPLGTVMETTLGSPVGVHDGHEGEMAVIEVSELTVKVAADVPKVTPVAPVNPKPLITTFVPPVVGPLFGDTFVISGP
jgi:hypothetical protein